MNRLLILLYSITLIGCWDQPKLLNNGLTKKANKITIYFIDIQKDSLNINVQDTLSVTVNKYNSNNQIFNLIQTQLFNDEKVEIEYIYDEFNKIKKEIGKMSNENLTFTVNYFYKDKLLLKTKSETKNEIFHMKQIGKYEYNSDNTLKESSLISLYIDKESKDTITNIIEISKYDNKELVTESKLYNFIEPRRNLIFRYKYDCRILIKTLQFNYMDSLISNRVFKYEFDRFDNWIKKESYLNNELNYIQTKEIEYK